jgi:hypothetical protein
MKHYENCYCLERMPVLFSVFLMNKFVKFDRQGSFESFEKKKHDKRNSLQSKVYIDLSIRECNPVKGRD